MPSPATTTLLFTLLLLTSTTTVSNSPSTAYELLEAYDLPVGLLPAGVTSYTLNTITGDFNVNIGNTCKFSIERFDIKYEQRISGVIGIDKLKNLKGVSVKLGLFWVSIVEVTREGDELGFLVGAMVAEFSVDNFRQSPECTGFRSWDVRSPE